MSTQAYNDIKNNTPNDYLNFIQLCRKKVEQYSASELKKCQVHHIVPRHHFQTHNLDLKKLDITENLVTLSFNDHIEAHKIRFNVYNEYADKLAYTRMSDMGPEAMLAMQQAGGQATNAILRSQGRIMHDPNWQREMAARSMARPDAREIRSAAGKKGIRTRHANRTVVIEDKYLWKVNDIPFLCTFNINNGGDLLRELHKARPTPLQRTAQLINGSKKRLHGWSCEKIE
jgi:hypothetical protein